MDVFLQNWPAVVAVATAVLTLLFLLALTREQACPYVVRNSLLTRNEQKFFAALQRAVQNDWNIFAMVRLADVLRVEAEAHQRQAWQNKINCKHVDFVLCDHYNLQPVLAIEVDDRTHLRQDRQRRDQFLNDAMQQAGLPLLRITAASKYDPAEIRAQLETLVPRHTAPRSKRKTRSPN